MEERSIYRDIARRTAGDIYIGVVGPVRTGKSTFIKRFMDTVVIPNISDESLRTRATDELPQSSGGRTVMTTEPKFVPENAVSITLRDNARLNVRMIDCVGYIVDSALGFEEEDGERLVKTPWSEKEIPFREAAELGTKKVITEHSTIGILVTTDGSIGDIPRSDYVDAEERVADELKASGKPFIILLNSVDPDSLNSRNLAKQLSKKYMTPTVPVDCAALDEEAVKSVLAAVLFEFPVKEVRVKMPSWVTSLEPSNHIKKELYSSIRAACGKIGKIREVEDAVAEVGGSELLETASLDAVDLGKGRADISLTLLPGLFYSILSEKTGLDIHDEKALLDSVVSLSESQKMFDKIALAYDDVMETGYGIVMPSMEELSLDEPEIVKQGGKYGIRLKASAPSIHMMRVNTTAEVTPIVGSQHQSEELVNYLMGEFEESPRKIWESNIFGKSVSDLVNEGLHNKLYRMPAQARLKVGETIEKIINNGCNGLICIIL